MKNIGFIVDGSSTLSEEDFKKNGIKRIFFKIVENDSISYNDNLNEISYEKINQLHKENNFPKTSCSSIGEVMEAIEEELKKFDYLLIFTIANSISSQYNSIKMLENEPEFKDKIYVVNTQAQCYGLEYIVLESMKMVKEGKPVEEIIKFAEEQNEFIHTLFVPESSKPATSSGRVSKALIGKVLDKTKITPILSMNQKIGLYSIAKNYKKALEKMVYKTKKVLDESNGTWKFISIYYSLYDENWRKFLIDEVAKQFQIKENQIIIKKTPLIIFTNTGKNAFGLSIGLNKKYIKE